MGNIKRFKRIYIEITSSCNLKCSFCQETKRPAHFMPIEDFGHILDEIRPYTNYIYLHVKGEPLLHPQLADILSLCRDCGITVNLTTNGTLIRQRLDTLIKYPVHQINVSMHSADDNDCIDMDTYINDLFYSCETLLDKTDTEISLRLWNTKNEPFYLVSETALSNVIFISMCKVHLNGLNLTEVIITNAASVREYAHILPY